MGEEVREGGGTASKEAIFPRTGMFGVIHSERAATAIAEIWGWSSRV